MFEKLKAAITTDPMDVLVWECTPLAIMDGDGKARYWHNAKVEMKPYPPNGAQVGHAVALSPDSAGSTPELQVDSLQHVDAPILLNRRPGIILTGSNAAGEPETWLINGEADRVMAAGDFEVPEYDEDTAKLAEEELHGQQPEGYRIDTVF